MARLEKENLRIALAQINCTVGDLSGNSRKILRCIQEINHLGVDIIAFPELSITGYPPEDLLLKPKFIEDNLKKIKELSESINDIVAVIGFVDRAGKHIYNSAAVIYDRKIRGVYHKNYLPNYGVFDEKRYFAEERKTAVFRLGKAVFGVNICEDIWHTDGPIEEEVSLGAKLIININASPYHLGKIKERERIVLNQAKLNRVFVSYVNLVGGQDELVFDGQSMIVDSQGKIVCRAAEFKEDLLITDLDIPVQRIAKNKRITAIKDTLLKKKKAVLPKREAKHPGPIEEVYQALMLGLGDYVRKNGFQKVVIGLSGGIDSAIVAALAVDVLGKDNVIAVFLPSPYTSQESKIDASALASNLGIRLLDIPIEQIYRTYLETLKPHFSGKEEDATEENLQARIRGNILMALSNKFGWLVLTTGNKSEMSTGYATLYGDMAGGFAVIKDVPKTLVYKLTRYRNSLGSVIPERVLTRPPTAELKPGQKDTDTLPPYETLDPILKAYIEDDLDLSKITGSGFSKEMVSRVLDMVDRSEYKRRQSPPGIKITHKAFGRDRRMPITNRYKISISS